MIALVRGDGTTTTDAATIGLEGFEALLVGDDGSSNQCSRSSTKRDNSAEGFMKLSLTNGAIRNTASWATTVIFKMSSEEVRVQEAMSYFDSDIYMSGSLHFDGNGYIDLPQTDTRPLFRQPIVQYDAGHPGIVSIRPTVQANVALQGEGQIDGYVHSIWSWYHTDSLSRSRFTVNFRTGTNELITMSAPVGLGSERGSALGQTFPNPAFEGSFSTDSREAERILEGTAF